MRERERERERERHRETQRDTQREREREGFDSNILFSLSQFGGYSPPMRSLLSFLRDTILSLNITLFPLTTKNVTVPSFPSPPSPSPSPSPSIHLLHSLYHLQCVAFVVSSHIEYLWDVFDLLLPTHTSLMSLSNIPNRVSQQASLRNTVNLMRNLADRNANAPLYSVPTQALIDERRRERARAFTGGADDIMKELRRREMERRIVSEAKEREARERAADRQWERMEREERERVIRGSLYERDREIAETRALLAHQRTMGELTPDMVEEYHAMLQRRRSPILDNGMEPPEREEAERVSAQSFTSRHLLSLMSDDSSPPPPPSPSPSSLSPSVSLPLPFSVYPPTPSLTPPHDSSQYPPPLDRRLRLYVSPYLGSQTSTGFASVPQFCRHEI